MNNIESEIIRLQDIGSIEDILDYIYNLEDELLDRNFENFNLFLGEVDVTLLSDTSLLGIAVITDPWKDQLNNRKNFIEKLFAIINSRYNKDDAIQLLYGIE
jgi:hypothetical protein